MDLGPGGYLLIGGVVAVVVVLTAIAAMVAIWHPDEQRRNDAFRVLRLLLGLFRRMGGAP